jgi:ribosomal protein S18 acetylase RimI-like enzyme
VQIFIVGGEMKKWIIIVIYFFMVMQSAIAISQDTPRVIIRPGIHADIAPALELDRRVTIEYFKMLFTTYYTDLPIAYNPDYYLGLDLNFDKKLFADCVNMISCERLYVAFDQELGKLAGFVAFHKESDCVGEIYLLMIDKEYRRLGLGKKLIDAAINSMADIDFWGLYVHTHNQEARTFYASLGFEYLGLGPKADIKIYPGITYGQIFVYLGMPVRAHSN